MKTVTLPDDVYESAAQEAATRNVPIEQLVAEIVARQTQRVTPEEFERLEKLQQELYAKPKHYRFNARQRLTRDEINDRRLSR